VLASPASLRGSARTAYRPRWCHARSPGPGEALLPMSPSSSNQRANISLTRAVGTDTHANSSTWSGPTKRRPRSHPGAASPCPL